LISWPFAKVSPKIESSWALQLKDLEQTAQTARRGSPDESRLVVPVAGKTAVLASLGMIHAQVLPSRHCV